jgi:hypothetical protein
MEFSCVFLYEPVGLRQYSNHPGFLDSKDKFIFKLIFKNEYVEMTFIFLAKLCSTGFSFGYIIEILPFVTI